MEKVVVSGEEKMEKMEKMEKVEKEWRRRAHPYTTNNKSL